MGAVLFKMTFEKIGIFCKSIFLKKGASVTRYENDQTVRKNINF